MVERDCNNCLHHTQAVEPTGACKICLMEPALLPLWTNEETSLADYCTSLDERHG